MKAKEMTDYEIMQALRNIALRLDDNHNEQSDWAADIIREASARIYNKKGGDQ